MKPLFGEHLSSTYEGQQQMITSMHSPHHYNGEKTSDEIESLFFSL